MPQFVPSISDEDGCAILRRALWIVEQLNPPEDLRVECFRAAHMICGQGQLTGIPQALPVMDIPRTRRN